MEHVLSLACVFEAIRCAAFTKKGINPFLYLKLCCHPIYIGYLV